MILEKRYWDGLLNADDADFIIAEREYVNARNVRFGSTDFATGAVGYIESIMGTTEIPNPLIMPDSTCIGSTYDVDRNRILFFVYRENLEDGGAGIYCYDIGMNQIFLVLSGFFMGLTLEPIHSCFVLNGNLYWTNSTNSQPRRINIDSGIKTYEPSYPGDATAYTLPIAESVISWIRKPPVFPPSIQKVTQTVPPVIGNFIRYEAFQFCYRYVYRDYEVSTLSGLSILSNYNREDETYNQVTVTITTEEFIEQDVLQVDLVVRFVSGDYSIIKSWNKDNADEAQEIIDHNAGITPLTYIFYNNQKGIPLDSAYANKPFDSVPIYAETCATAKNRTFMGNIVTGYDTPITSSLTATLWDGGVTGRVFKSDAYYQLGVTFYDEFQRKCGYIAPPAARIQTPETIYGTFSTPELYSQILWNLTNPPAAGEIPDWAFFYSVDITRCLRTRYFLQMRGRNSTYVRKNEDGTYEYGIAEYSADLDGCAFDISPLTSAGMGYIFTEGDLFKYFRNTDLNFDLSITGQDGTWLICELIDLGTLNISVPFLFEIYTPYQSAANEPAYEVGVMYEITSGREYSVPAGFIDGDVYILERNDSNRVNYTMNPLDEPRNDDQDATLGALYASQTATSTDFATGSSPFRDLVGFNIATNTDRVIFENLTGSDMTLYLAGNIQCMPDSDRTWRAFVADNNNTQTILVPDTSMTAGVMRNFTFSQTVTLAAGDRLFIFHHQSVANSMYFYQLNLTILVPSEDIAYDVEAMSPNDKFYRNWNYPDTGRPNFMDSLGQSELTGAVVWSNTFSEDTKNNGLSSYEALNRKILPAECGDLRKLQPTSKTIDPGIVMLGVCEAETVSMYLGEVQLVSAASNAFVAQSDAVIGTINALKGSFGTVNPESVKEVRGNVYWYDLRNGKYIQYSLNGLFPISNYKTQKFWRLFSEQYFAVTPEQIVAYGSRPYVFTGFDMHNQELLVSVPKVGDPPRGYLPDYPSIIYPFDICDFQAKSMVYRLDKEPNRWQGSYDITAENYCNGQDELYSWKNGVMYLHNSGPFGEFYGQSYPSALMLVFNQVPGEPKIYFNNHVRANLIPNFVYFRTEDPYVQASDLVDFDFQNIEGVFYAALYRDKLIPTASGFSTAGLLTEEVIRGDTLKAMYEWNVSGTPLQLRFISVGYQLSRGHLK